MKKIWFRAKKYGWGWYPCTWQGWLVILAFVVFQIWNAMRLDRYSDSASDTLRPFLIQTFVAVVVLIATCYWKGEKPGWRWGNKEEENKKIG